MKKLIMLLTAVFLISGISFAQAATTAKTPAAGVKHERQMGQWQGKALELSDELNLNDAQKVQITDILKQMHPQMKALREDTTLSMPDRMAKMKEIRTAAEAKIDKVLTTDQKAKLDTLRAAAREKMQARMKEMRKEHQAAKTAPATN